MGRSLALREFTRVMISLRTIDVTSGFSQVRNRRRRSDSSQEPESSIIFFRNISRL